MINLINTFCEEHKPSDIWNNSPFKKVKELTIILRQREMKFKKA